MKDNLAVAYAMKKRAKKMADDGDVKGVHKPNKYPMGDAKGESEAGDNARWSMAHAYSGNSSAAGREMSKAKEKHKKILGEMQSMKKPELMAEGGMIGSHQSEGKPEVDGGDVCPSCNSPIPHESRGPKDSYPSMGLNQEGEHDEGEGDMNSVPPMIMKIMMGRAKGYSEGGKVANEGEDKLDDMADGEPNEFDDLVLDDDMEGHDEGSEEIGDEQESKDRADVIHRIMKSRSKKDKNPRPA